MLALCALSLTAHLPGELGAAPPQSSPAPSRYSPELSAELFTAYHAQRQAFGQLSEFSLERAELGLQSPHVTSGGADSLSAELRLEAVRAAGARSVQGLDGDSLVLRLRRAWGSYQRHIGALAITLRGGLIPDAWHELVMRAYPLRALGPSLAEREGAQRLSDLGGTLILSAPQLILSPTLSLSVSNGEGRRAVEQNEGKDSLVTLSLTPLKSQNHELWLSAGYLDGSTGPLSSPRSRAWGALWFESKRLSTGLLWTSAWGLNGQAQLSMNGAQGWLIFKALTGAREGWLSPFLSAEWQSFKLPSASQDGASAQLGLRHSFKLSPQLTMRLFERLEWREGSDLSSPVVGSPKLGERWRASLCLEVSFGVSPPNAYGRTWR